MAKKKKTKTRKWYSEELNKMFGYEGDSVVEFEKLPMDDLVFFYFNQKVRFETGKGPRTSPPGGFMRAGPLDGAIVDKVLSEMDPGEIEELKKKYPIAARLAEKMLNK